MITSLIVAAISMGIVYLFGCIGETIIEKGGNLNLGIPGIMCLGALGGAVGVNVYFKIFGTEKQVIVVVVILVSIFFAFLFAALGGMIYAFLTVSLHANQNVTGLTLTTFGVGLMKFFGSNMNHDNFTTASKAICWQPHATNVCTSCGSDNCNDRWRRNGSTCCPLCARSDVSSSRITLWTSTGPSSSGRCTTPCRTTSWARK